MESMRFQTGIYLRISKEDEDIGGYGKAESGSIHAQRTLCSAFVKRHPEMELYDIYTDEGYSGSTFERPAVQRLLADIHAGMVNCIVVKDLSRFGRDYIQAGQFLQKIFPSLGVRFIAVTDQYDSLTADQAESSLIVPIKNFVNDAYCLDISNKVKSHQKVKRKNGDFIGAFAVYGYSKNTEHKNRLVPDLYAAQIVRFIYVWKLEGMSLCAIAKKLNALGVLSPMEYKRSKGERFATGFAAGKPAAWSAIAVKRILQNEIYTGTMVQGKSEKISYKLKTIRQKPKKQWERVAQTHPPIISKELFADVQSLLTAGARDTDSQQAYLFHGRLVCADCQKSLIRRVNNYKGKQTLHFICPTRNKGQGCTRHSIAQERLLQILQTVLSVQLAVLTDTKKLCALCTDLKVSTNQIAPFQQEIARLCTERDRYQDLPGHLMQDFANGLLTDEDIHVFQKLYEAQYAELKKTIKKQEQTVKLLSGAELACQEQIERWKHTMSFARLNRLELALLIQNIHIYEGKRICISLAVKHPF